MKIYFYRSFLLGYKQIKLQCLSIDNWPRISKHIVKLSRLLFRYFI